MADFDPAMKTREANGPWFVAKTKASAEKRAKMNLERQGFGTFLPVEESQQTRGRRGVVLLRPVFPGYIFVQLDLQKPGWSSVRNTFGVSSLLEGADGRPQQMPDAAMRQLFLRTDASGKLLPPDEIAVGDRMRIVKGPFANWMAEVTAAPDASRVHLLLEIMGQAVKLTTSRDNLSRF